MNWRFKVALYLCLPLLVITFILWLPFLWLIFNLHGWNMSFSKIIKYFRRDILNNMSEAFSKPWR